MEHYEQLQRQCKMLSCLAALPKRILSLHGEDNVTEFVLHDLCHQDCFNLNKAAYFVDNPDFNCSKGVAGFSRDEPFNECEVIWSKADAFSEHMKKSAFNQRVR